MADLEEEYMEWAVGCADDREAAAPMAASSRCQRPAAGMRWRWRRDRNRFESKVFR
jgi:hypothetical protein